MERIHLEKDITTAVSSAVEVLRAGGVILYPTDTLYGLGADAFSDQAVPKIYEIKKRDESKPIHCVVADIAMAEQYAEFDERAKMLAAKFLPGPLTLVVRKKPEVTSGIGKGMETIAFRIPDNEFCIALARAFGPFTTTSANVSGAPTGRRIDEILLQLGLAAEKIHLVIDAGELPQRKPSTVVDLSSSELKILREGAIPAAEIEVVFHG